MHASRQLVLAAALALAMATQGCKRDFKAPEPKAGNVERMTSPSGAGNPRTSAEPGSR